MSYVYCSTFCLCGRYDHGVLWYDQRPAKYFKERLGDIFIPIYLLFIYVVSTTYDVPTTHLWLIIQISISVKLFSSYTSYTVSIFTIIIQSIMYNCKVTEYFWISSRNWSISLMLNRRVPNANHYFLLICSIYLPT